MIPNFPEFPDGTDPWIIAFTVIVVSVIIAGTAVVKLWIEQADRRNEKRTEAVDLNNRAALDRVLENTPTINEVKEKLDRDYTALKQHEALLDKLQQSVEETAEITEEMHLTFMRQRLFAHPRSRLEHEELLDLGEQYIARGGNGAGHKRLDLLGKRYTQRMMTDNWDYTHPLNDGDGESDEKTA